MRTFRRSDRVASELQAALTQILNEGLRDPRITPITITSLRVSDDLGHANIGFVPLGGTGQTERILEGLRAASGWLRREMGRRVRLKYLPQLHFHIDQGLEESVRMASLLQSMEDKRVTEGEE